MRARLGAAAAAAALLTASTAANAQLAVSANDGKQLRPGELPASRTADSVSVIDLGQTPPRVLGQVETPASLIGPPATVAVASDGSFAVVGAPQKVDPADATKLVSSDTLSVLDLRTPSAPKVIQSLASGAAPAGIAINRARTLALVANSGEDSLSIFTIRNRMLTPAGKIVLAPQSKPTDVVFTPDGREALVVTQTQGRILRFRVSGGALTKSDVEIQPGVQPYGVVLSRDGAYAFTTNLGGRTALNGSTPPAPRSGPRIGTLAVVDLKSNRLVSTVDAGATPEHLSLSPDGKYLQTTVINGSSAPATSASYNPYGLLKVFRIDDGALVPVAEARTGQWCQGATWRKDSRRIYLQCAAAKEIEVYRFEGETLTREPESTMKFDARPGSISSAIAR